MRLGDRIEAEDVEFVPGKCCASVQGFSLHAGVAVNAHDRARLERLLRYITRGPIATQRLSELPDGRIAYELRHPWRDGTTHVVFLGVEFLEKLAVLTPAPRGIVPLPWSLCPGRQVAGHCRSRPCAGRQQREELRADPPSHPRQGQQSRRLRCDRADLGSRPGRSRRPP